MHISGYECQMNGSLVPVSVRLCSLANMEPCSITKNKYMVFFIWWVRKQNPREYINVYDGISSKSGFLTVIETCALFFQHVWGQRSLIMLYTVCVVINVERCSIF